MTEWVLTAEQEAVLQKWWEGAKGQPRTEGTGDPQLRRLVEMVWDASYEDHKWDNYDSRD